jgi:50S ribosomal protein L16 3-hydroxylase
MSVDHFMKVYWQRRPLFIKGAVAPERLSMELDDLLALARNADVESRLVDRHKGKWKLQHGPIEKLPRRERDWTLLVQGVNLHTPVGDALLDEFRWLPHARLDDLMISYAVDGGGVGPHTDSYDVFLLQGIGTRRWQISPARDATLLSNVPVKLLANFRAEEEYLCEPGDLLYLPPQYAHDGTAVGVCSTWSVGFRTPGHRELVREFLGRAADDELPGQSHLNGRYADPGLEIPKHPAQVPERMTIALANLLQGLRWDKAATSEFLGTWLSEPKPNTTFEAPLRLQPFARFSSYGQNRGVELDRRTQMLHDRTRIFCNGESSVATAVEGKILRKLADDRRLSAAEMATVPEDVMRLLYTWYCDGWLHIE